MKKTIMIIGISIIGLLNACSSNVQTANLHKFSEYNAESFLKGLKDGKIISEDFFVSVYPDEVIVSTADEELIIPIDEDLFFLSVAPFIDHTHDCFYHSATGCKGELVDKDFDILFVDHDGQVMYDQSINSGSNGFIDLWLPRGIEGTLTIWYNGLVVEQEVSTIGDAKTCETTMRLQ